MQFLCECANNPESLGPKLLESLCQLQLYHSQLVTMASMSVLNFICVGICFLSIDLELHVSRWKISFV